MYCSVKKSILDLYLEYVNDYLTLSSFALDKNLSLSRAGQIVAIGEKLNEKGLPFEALTDDAKEKAREWFRSDMFDWWDQVYEDAASIHLKITGFDIGRGQSCSGEFIESPIDTARQIIEDHGPMCETYKTAKKYYSFLYAFNDNDREDAETEFLCDLLEDYQINLTNEWDYINKDEQVDESIICNEYSFTTEGEIV